MNPNTALALTAAILGLGLLAAIVAHYHPLALKRDVLVVLKSGETIRGVLLSRRPRYLILGNAAVVANGVTHTIDGTVEIDRDNVTWVQVP